MELFIMYSETVQVQKGRKINAVSQFTKIIGPRFGNFRDLKNKRRPASEMDSRDVASRRRI